jgi:hypothetical protein
LRGFAEKDCALAALVFDKAYANATAGRVPSQLFPDCCKPLDDS